MNEDPREPDLEGHLSPEDLAVLAEGRGSERTVLDAAEHLARCRNCMSAYADVVRYRAGWLVFPDAFAGDTSASAAPRGGRAGARTRSFGRSPLWATAAALVVLLGVAWFWLAGRREPRHDNGPVTALIERASASGLVIPGGEAGAMLPSLYRSGPVADDDAMRALDQMSAEYDRDPRPDRDVSRLAAGLVAAGRIDLAGSYIVEGLRRAPRDPRLLTLAGIVAHRTGNLARAEQQLRDALRASPDDLVATLDLGLVLKESRGLEAAAPCFERVMQRAPGSPLAQRARAALGEQPR